MPVGVPGMLGVSGGVYAGDIRLCGMPGVPGCDVFSKSPHPVIPERYCVDGLGSGDNNGDAWEGSLLGVVIL